jgi:hypothetical protein
MKDFDARRISVYKMNDEDISKAAEEASSYDRRQTDELPF